MRKSNGMTGAYYSRSACNGYGAWRSVISCGEWALDHLDKYLEDDGTVYGRMIASRARRTIGQIINTGEGQIHLGYFNTEEEAFERWKLAKTGKLFSTQKEKNEEQASLLQRMAGQDVEQLL